MAKVNLTLDQSEPGQTDLQRHTCVDIDECEVLNMNHCTQKCINLKGSYECKCADNYIDSHGDGLICEATWKEDAIVIVAYGSEIRQLRQNISDYVYNNLIEDEIFVSSMDIDPINRHLYWIDQGTQEIKRSFVPKSKSALGHPQTLSSIYDYLSANEYVDITALSFDWLSMNLYYAEGYNGTIKVAKADGRYSRTLIREYADSVHSMVVNPLLGIIYWINTGHHHAIMSASMNGENVRILVDTGLDSPDSITIDYFMDNRVFWSDHKRNLIESVRFDGSDRTRMTHVALRNPFKIDIFENNLYWLARDLGNVNKVDKFGRGAHLQLIEGLDLTGDMKILHPFKIPSNCNFFIFILRTKYLNYGTKVIYKKNHKDF